MGVFVGDHSLSHTGGVHFSVCVSCSSNEKKREEATEAKPGNQQNSDR